MTVNICKCNKCGKYLDAMDLQENRGIHDQFGYGSKHDGDYIDLDLCAKCFDEIIDWLRPQCQYDFISK